MADIAPASTAAAGSPDEHGEDVVVVAVEARTPVEQRLVADWASKCHPGADVVDHDDPGLAQRLALRRDPLVAPVRVTWLPPERDGERRVRARDLVLLSNPRRPWAVVQARIARRHPERVHLSVGEPATVSDLKARFADATSDDGDAAFGAFVSRQATLACARAERTVIGDRYKVPRLVAEQITADAAFRAKVAALAQRLGRPFDGVLADAESCLKELATVQSPLAIDAFRAVMWPMHGRAWTVRADTVGLARLRELNRRHALVFLPTHRSYVDPLVLGEVLHEHDFPRNHLLGGDNMAFWPIGPLGRRAGVIFIRRSLGDDAIYKLALREFLGHLVAKRFNLEWYFEGGRTRTGKLRPPKLGLMRYLTAALEDGRAEDVVLVPTSIVYDRLHEVTTLTAEQAGAKKRSEGLRWMAEYIRAQSRNVGAARVHFGEPISLRTALAAAGEGRAQLEKVAFRVADGINRVTPVTATSLVTLALLGARGRALTFEQVTRLTAPLLDYLERRDVPGAAELRSPSALRDGLDSLVEAGAVERYDGGTEPVWTIATGGHHVAAFYRNGALHHVVNRAIVELALLRLADGAGGEDPLEDAWADALALRDLLKFEFFFAEKARFRAELAAEVELFGADWGDRIGTPQDAADLLAESGVVVAHRALRSFLDAQLVAAERLAARDPGDTVEPEKLLDECLAVGRQMFLQGRLHGPEAVSRELFSAALRLAGNRDLLSPGSEDLGARREAWLHEVREVLERLQRIEKSDLALLDEVLRGDAG